MIGGVDPNLELDEAVLELQRAFDQERLTPNLNLVTKRASCEQQIPAGDGLSPKACGHVAVVQFADIITTVACQHCGEPTPTGHRDKEVTVRLCLLHYLARIERWVDPQMDLTNPKDLEQARATAKEVGKLADEAEKAAGKTSTYSFEPSEKDRTLCVCGFVIGSAIASTFHDYSHKRYLLSEGEGGGDDEETAAAKPTRRKRSAGDATAAVSARVKRKTAGSAKKTPARKAARK